MCRSRTRARSATAQPLACKTDKVDARVLAELCRRDLVPSLWLPSLDERALRERLRRRMHLVRLRASAMNRVFGLLTQWGLRISLGRLRADDAMRLLADRGVEETWRRSIAEALAVIELFDERLAPLERELRQAAKADARVILLKTIPGVGDLLGLTLASEIGDVSRFSTPRKLIGYAGLAPRVNQSGDRPRTGALSKAGSRTLRWAAVEAAHASWRPTNPWHQHYSELVKRAGKNPAKSSVARKILTACWHILNRHNPSSPPARSRAAPASRQAPAAFRPPDGPWPARGFEGLSSVAAVGEGKEGEAAAEGLKYLAQRSFSSVAATTIALPNSLRRSPSPRIGSASSAPNVRLSAELNSKLQVVLSHGFPALSIQRSSVTLCWVRCWTRSIGSTVTAV
jgi:transposase